MYLHFVKIILFNAFLMHLVCSQLALVSRTQREPIREYPVAYRQPEAYPTSQEIQFPKFNSVSYSRLS